MHKKLLLILAFVLGFPLIFVGGADRVAACDPWDRGDWREECERRGRSLYPEEYIERDSREWEGRQNIVWTSEELSRVTRGEPQAVEDWREKIRADRVASEARMEKQLEEWRCEKIRAEENKEFKGRRTNITEYTGDKFEKERQMRKEAKLADEKLHGSKKKTKECKRNWERTGILCPKCTSTPPPVTSGSFDSRNINTTKSTSKRPASTTNHQHETPLRIPESPEIQEECRYFNGAPNSCRYGNNCKFYHFDPISDQRERARRRKLRDRSSQAKSRHTAGVSNASVSFKPGANGKLIPTWCEIADSDDENPGKSSRDSFLGGIGVEPHIELDLNNKTSTPDESVSETNESYEALRTSRAWYTSPSSQSMMSSTDKSEDKRKTVETKGTNPSQPSTNYQHETPTTANPIIEYPTLIDRLYAAQKTAQPYIHRKKTFQSLNTLKFKNTDKSEDKRKTVETKGTNPSQPSTNYQHETPTTANPIIEYPTLIDRLYAAQKTAQPYIHRKKTFQSLNTLKFKNTDKSEDKRKTVETKGTNPSQPSTNYQHETPTTANDDKDITTIISHMLETIQAMNVTIEKYNATIERNYLENMGNVKKLNDIIDDIVVQERERHEKVEAARQQLQNMKRDEKTDEVNW